MVDRYYRSCLLKRWKSQDKEICRWGWNNYGCVLPVGSLIFESVFILFGGCKWCLIHENKTLVSCRFICRKLARLWQTFVVYRHWNVFIINIMHWVTATASCLCFMRWLCCTWHWLKFALLVYSSSKLFVLRITRNHVLIMFSVFSFHSQMIPVLGTCQLL